MTDLNFSEDFFLALAFRFEQENGKKLDPFELSLAQRELPQAVILSEIKDQITLNIINGRITDPLLGSAIWALGKSFDTNLKTFSIKQLERALERDSANTLYQAMIALDNLEEPIFQDDTSSSVEEFSKNLNSARIYLKNLKG